MLTRTGCYSKGLEKNKMQLIFMMKEQKHQAEKQDQVQFLNFISTDTFCCLFFLEIAENNIKGENKTLLHIMGCYCLHCPSFLKDKKVITKNDLLITASMIQNEQDLLRKSDFTLSLSLSLAWW